MITQASFICLDFHPTIFCRCPNNVLDFYEVIKYVSLHASDLGVDPARIAIAGESGGGYICAGAMVQLARQDEAHLVKLAVPIIPMLSDDSFGDPAAMTTAEADNAVGQQKVWRLIAGPGVCYAVFIYISQSTQFFSLRRQGKMPKGMLNPKSQGLMM